MSDFGEVISETQVLCFGKNGETCDEKQAFARKTIVSTGDKETISYHILTKSRVSVDPKDFNDTRFARRTCQWTKVNKGEFDLYHEYLKTGKHNLLIRSRRVK